MKTIVRCQDRMVFEVDPDTWEPKRYSSYDPWCFSHPEPSVKYISHDEWTLRNYKLNKKTGEYEYDFSKTFNH